MRRASPIGYRVDKTWGGVARYAPKTGSGRGDRDGRNALPDHPKLARGAHGQVDDATSGVEAIIDDDDNRAAARGVRNLNLRAERQGRVRGGQRFLVEPYAARGALPVVGLTVIGRHAGLMRERARAAVGCCRACLGDSRLLNGPGRRFPRLSVLDRGRDQYTSCNQGRI